MYPVAFFRSQTDNVPVQKTLAWNAICALLKKRSVRNDKDGPLFSPTLYQDDTTRASANVVSLSLFVADVDCGIAPGPLLKRAGELGLACAVYSSHSSTSLHPKWRAVFPLAEPVAGEEWGTAWPKFVQHLGITADSSRRDLAGLYFLPSCPKAQEAHAFFYATEGEPLDYKALPEAEPAHATTGKTRSVRNAPGGVYPPGLRIPDALYYEHEDVITDYNERADHHPLLMAPGWQLVDSSPEERWRRPGKNDSHSGTFGHGGSRIFVCFTSSAPPLLENSHYRPFDLRCVLEFGGDIARCAKACRTEGYGQPTEEETVPLSQPADGDPEVEDVPAEPLWNYLRSSDRKIADQRRRGMKRSKYTEHEYTLAQEFLPAEMIDASVREIYVGKTLRKREEIKTRDMIVQLGAWYDGLPHQHNARPYIVARAFGLPTPDPVTGQDFSLHQKITDLQSYVRIWKAFGACEVDAPARLYKTLASVKCPNRRQYWLEEWTEGRGGNVEGTGNIYDRIANEKRRERESGKNSKNITPIYNASGEREDFDPETGEVASGPPETVMMAMSATLYHMLQVFAAKAQEMGLTAEELMSQFLLSDLQKHSHENVFEGENDLKTVQNAPKNESASDVPSETKWEPKAAPAEELWKDKIDLGAVAGTADAIVLNDTAVPDVEEPPDRRELARKHWPALVAAIEARSLPAVHYKARYPNGDVFESYDLRRRAGELLDDFISLEYDSEEEAALRMTLVERAWKELQPRALVPAGACEEVDEWES